MVLTNIYPFINSLLDPISEAHDQLIELGFLSSGPPGARSYDSGEPFVSYIALNAVSNVKASLEVGKG